MSDILRIYALLKRFMPLTIGEIPLLAWRNIHAVPYTDVYVISVYQTLNSQNVLVDYVQTGDVDSVRDIPLPPLIAAMLFDWQDDMRKLLPYDTVMDEVPIVTEIGRHGIPKPLSYKEAKVLNNRLEEVAGIYDTKHLVRLHGTKTKVVDLNRINTDLFRRDWTLQAKRYGLSSSEIEYLLGNAQTSTYGKHYVDFRNPFVLQMMAHKVARWVVNEANNDDISTKDFPSNETTTYKDNIVAGSCITARYDVDVPANADNVVVTVNSRYGANINILLWGDGQK